MDPASPARRRIIAWPFACQAAALLAAAGASGRPAAADATGAPAGFVDGAWRDASRGRELPVRIRSGTAASGAPLVVYSHGLGGTRAGGAQWADHWARNGLVVLTVQHPGSDASIWRREAGSTLGARTREEIMERMRKGAGPEAFLDRIGDLRFAVDQALARHARGEEPFARIDPARIGMSGHSFGAVATQAICGEAWGGYSFADPRVKAGIALSPSPARDGEARSFAAMTMPMLLITGTQDGNELGDTRTAEARRATFDELPGGHKFLLVLDGATHLTFDGGERQNQTGEGPRHRAAVEAVSLAFWNAALRDDATARSWLAGGARSAIAPGDTFKAG